MEEHARNALAAIAAIIAIVLVVYFVQQQRMVQGQPMQQMLMPGEPSENVAGQAYMQEQLRRGCRTYCGPCSTMNRIRVCSNPCYQGTWTISC